MWFFLMIGRLCAIASYVCYFILFSMAAVMNSCFTCDFFPLWFCIHSSASRVLWFVRSWKDLGVNFFNLFVRRRASSPSRRPHNTWFIATHWIRILRWLISQNYCIYPLFFSSFWCCFCSLIYTEKSNLVGCFSLIWLYYCCASTCSTRNQIQAWLFSIIKLSLLVLLQKSLEWFVYSEISVYTEISVCV